jgi:hypothetical protein
LSLRVSAIVLKSGLRHRSNYISAILRCDSRQTAAGLDAAEIAVQVQLQRRRGMVEKAPSRGRHRTVETRSQKVPLLDKHFSHPRRIVFRYVLLQTGRKQRALISIVTLNVACHRSFVPCVSITPLISCFGSCADRFHTTSTQSGLAPRRVGWRGQQTFAVRAEIPAYAAGSADTPLLEISGSCKGWEMHYT